MDQNLSVALFSTILPSILPYILNLDTCSLIWSTLERRFFSTNGSRVIQLKNELHSVSMKNQPMQEYLSHVKRLVDNITAAGGTLDSEDVILYILNGLPAIRTKLIPINLDDLYSLLCSEEVNQVSDAVKELDVADSSQPPDSHFALTTSRGHERAHFTYSRGRGRDRQAPKAYPPPPRPPRFNGDCQICGKQGHSALTCWHQSNLQYNANTPMATAAFLADSTTAPWYLDSGATTTSRLHW